MGKIPMAGLPSNYNSCPDVIAVYDGKPVYITKEFKEYLQQFEDD